MLPQKKTAQLKPASSGASSGAKSRQRASAKACAVWNWLMMRGAGWVDFWNHESTYVGMPDAEPYPQKQFMQLVAEEWKAKSPNPAVTVLTYVCNTGKTVDSPMSLLSIISFLSPQSNSYQQSPAATAITVPLPSVAVLEPTRRALQASVALPWIKTAAAGIRTAAARSRTSAAPTVAPARTCWPREHSPNPNTVPARQHKGPSWPLHMCERAAQRCQPRYQDSLRYGDVPDGRPGYAQEILEEVEKEVLEHQGCDGAPKIKQFEEDMAANAEDGGDTLATQHGFGATAAFPIIFPSKLDIRWKPVSPRLTMPLSSAPQAKPAKANRFGMIENHLPATLDEFQALKRQVDVPPPVTIPAAQSWHLSSLSSPTPETTNRVLHQYHNQFSYQHPCRLGRGTSYHLSFDVRYQSLRFVPKHWGKLNADQKPAMRVDRVSAAEKKKDKDEKEK
ncbi:hypothetical protein DL769_005962 [Monosporascus sp. CRB-8-3]|nr:hypothetical protein DL769_005962 [Monosporascus sp. CRB-8-3]